MEQAADYEPNEDESITFCPDANGNKVSATFGIGGTGFAFDVDASDTIFIYDGLSVSDPILDTFNNNMIASWVSFSIVVKFFWVLNNTFY